LSPPKLAGGAVTGPPTRSAATTASSAAPCPPLR